MRRAALIIRLFAVLSLGLWLAGAGAFAARAQDDADGTPTVTGEEPTVESQQAVQGTLFFAIYTCTTGPDNTVGALFAPGDFTPDGSCTEGGSASVSLDGGSSSTVNDGDSMPLDPATYSVDEDTIASPVDVTVPEDDSVTMSIVFYAIPKAQAETGSILIVKHICPESIVSTQDFDNLGDFYQQALTCPTITRPGDEGPSGAINGNDPSNQLSFDFSVNSDDGGSPATKTIADASFNPVKVCESDLGQDINGDSSDDICLDFSNYQYDGITEGTVSVTEDTAPDGYHFGAAAFVPGSGEESTLVNTDAETATVSLDTTGAASVTLHVFNFLIPPSNRIDIVKHLCDPSIVTKSDFNNLGDFYAQLQACPTITLKNDNGPDGAVNGGHKTFGFDVTGADQQTQNLDNATFVPSQTCEADLGQDIDGDSGNNLCLDTSFYQFDNVLQGGVTVVESTVPKGTKFGAVEFVPHAGDAATLVSASKGTIQLDTSSDGNVTIHVFNFVKPVEPTAVPTEEATTVPTEEPTQAPTEEPTEAPTEEPSAPTGTLQVLKFYCTGDDEYTEIDPLAPGEDVNLNDYIDDTCSAGAADFEITAFGTDDLGTYSAGDDGQLLVDLPVTDGNTGPHTLTELFSEESGQFDIEQDTITRVVVLNFEPGDQTDSALDNGSDGGDTTDEGNITSGADLADTGIGPANGPVDGSGVLLLAAVGLGLLAGAGALRKRVS